MSPLGEQLASLSSPLPGIPPRLKQSPPPQQITSQGFQDSGLPGPRETGVGVLPEVCEELSEKPGTQQRWPSIPRGVPLLTFAAFVPQGKSGEDTRSLYDYYGIMSFKLSGSWATDLDGKFSAPGRRETKRDNSFLQQPGLRSPCPKLLSRLHCCTPALNPAEHP